jgi:copper(I)-binding protein
MRGFAITVLSLVGVAVSASSAAASYPEYWLGPLVIEQVWSRPTQDGEKRGAAGYMKIENTGPTADRLMGGSTPFAGRFEIYGMSMDDGVMKMRPLSSGLEIKPGATVELKPDSFHVLMTDLKQPIQPGKSFTATLVFEKAGEVEVDLWVGGEDDAAAPAHPAHPH